MSTARVRYVRCTPTVNQKSSLYLADLDNPSMRSSVRDKIPVYISLSQPFTDIPLIKEVLLSLNQGTLRGFQESGLITTAILEPEKVSINDAEEDTEYLLVNTADGSRLAYLPWPVPEGTTVTVVKNTVDSNTVTILPSAEGGFLESPLVLTAYQDSASFFLSMEGRWIPLQTSLTAPPSDTSRTFLPTEERWVHNVTGEDVDTAGSKESPYQSISYAMAQLKPYGPSVQKVVNIMYSGMLYRDTILCNTSYWYIRGIDNPANSGDTGNIQRIGLRNSDTGPYANFPALVVTNLTDAAIQDFYAAPQHPVYTETDTNIAWTGPDLINAQVQDSSQVEGSDSVVGNMNVLIENLLLSSTGGNTRVISGTNTPPNISAMVLGKSPIYGVNPYGGIGNISLKRVRTASGVILKNTQNVSFESSLEFGSLLLDNTRPMVMTDPKPMRALKVRLGNTNASTNEVFLYDPTAGALNQPCIITENALVLTGAQIASPMRGQPLKMVGGVGLSGLFTDASFGQIQTGVPFYPLQTCYIGGNQAATKTTQTNGITSIAFDVVANLTVAESGVVSTSPTRIAGTLSLSTTRSCSFSQGKISGVVTLASAGTTTFERINFDSAVTVTTGTVIFTDCTFASNLLVNGGNVTLNGGSVYGTANRTAGSATANMTLFRNARVGTWTYNPPV